MIAVIGKPGYFGHLHRGGRVGNNTNGGWFSRRRCPLLWGLCKRFRGSLSMRDLSLELLPYRRSYYFLCGDCCAGHGDKLSCHVFLFVCLFSFFLAELKRGNENSYKVLISDECLSFPTTGNRQGSFRLQRAFFDIHQQTLGTTKLKRAVFDIHQQALGITELHRAVCIQIK
jgi:hypothetical protein